MTRREEIEEAAAVWLVREDRGLNPEEIEELNLWLNEDAAHRVAYLRLQDIWSYADRLAALAPRRQAVVQPRFKRWPLNIVAAAVIAMLVGDGANTICHDSTATETIATNVGQQRMVHLRDGTRIQLNTNTRIQTQVDSAVRTVRLDGGEAYFDVIHDVHHPFVVIAGGRRITDLGTKFSVSREGDKVEVVVKEGRVRVDLITPSALKRPVYASGNSVVVANAVEALVAPLSPQEIADKLDWRDGVLDFDQDTLAEVAAQFNRYNKRKLLIEGDARNIRIGGSFHADNIDGLTDLLQQGFNLSVRNRGEVVVISQK